MSNQRWKVGLFWTIGLAAGLAAFGYWLGKTGLYGLTIFVALPVLVGAVTAAIGQPRSGAHAFAMGVYGIAVASLGFLAIGIEGLICIGMAIPLAGPLGGLGAWWVYRVSHPEASGSSAGAGGAAMLLVLPLISLPYDLTATPEVFQVTTSMEIEAPPERGWPYVVQFPDIAAPEEWFFQAGIAYPIGTRLEGAGVGAARYCDLSTGPVVEVVEEWDAPRLLTFRVLESPAPMRELSPYGDITAKHLHGYFESQRGRFQLVELPGGRTRLVGTSWYRHGLWPAQYWRWWSDAIVHQIHLRVLRHVRDLAEG